MSTFQNALRQHTILPTLVIISYYNVIINNNKTAKIVCIKSLYVHTEAFRFLNALTNDGIALRTVNLTGIKNSTRMKRQGMSVYSLSWIMCL